jgi:hypothetical protein
MMQRLWTWLCPLRPIRLNAYWAVYWWDNSPPPPDAEPGAPPYGAALIRWPNEDPYYGL